MTIVDFKGVFPKDIIKEKIYIWKKIYIYEEDRWMQTELVEPKALNLRQK